MSKSKLLSIAVIFVFLSLFNSQADSVLTTIPVGTNPQAVTVNPVTNKIYVANYDSNNVTVIDGMTNAKINLGVGKSPIAIAVNPETNKIYVANFENDSVTIIDGETNSSKKIEVGSYPCAISINPATNKIYITNQFSNNITVIDGTKDTTTTVATGLTPAAIAVNIITNRIYVANQGSNNVTVIDGTTNATIEVAVGSYPSAITVNPVTNKIYVANQSSNNVTIIDGETNETTIVGAGTNPFAIAVNPVTNIIYVANQGSNNVTIIDGLTNITSTIAAGVFPWAIVVNPTSNKIFVTNNGSNYITVIDGLSKTAIQSTASTGLKAIAINTITNKVYAVNQDSNNITVIGVKSGTTDIITNIPIIGNPGATAVNQITNKIYVTYQSSLSGPSYVAEIDGVTNTTKTIYQGTGYRTFYSIAVNPKTNKIYVLDGGDYPSYNGSLIVIDGVTNASSVITVGANPRLIEVNPATNKIYVVNQGPTSTYDGSVTVIDGATNTTTTVSVGTGPNAIAINSVTNKIYVINRGAYTNSNIKSITVIDGSTNTATTIAESATSFYYSLAANPITNKIYVTDSQSNNIIVIDGETNAISTITIGSPSYLIAVNPETNKIYVAISSKVIVIDAATNETTELNTGSITEIVVNQLSNIIYLITDNTLNNILTIDGVTNAISLGINSIESGAPGVYRKIAVNPVTNKIYVTSSDYNRVFYVTAIDGKLFGPSVNVGITFCDIKVNPKTNKIYVANIYDNNISEIDGISNTVKTIPVSGSPIKIAINPLINKIYVVCNDSYNVTVIDGETNTTSIIEYYPIDIAVNPVTNKIYMIILNDKIIEIDEFNNTTKTIIVPCIFDSNSKIAVNSITNKIYVTNGGSITIIDGVTNETKLLSNGDSELYSAAIAVNSFTNKIYVAYDYRNDANKSNLTILDGNSDKITIIPNANVHYNNIEIIQETNKIYLSGNSVLDGETNTISVSKNSGMPGRFAINFITNKIYGLLPYSQVWVIIGEYGSIGTKNCVTSSSLPMIFDNKSNQVPIFVNVTKNPVFENNFIFTPHSLFLPNNTNIQKVYYQVDSYTGRWLEAIKSSDIFTANITGFTKGEHVIYAFAVDGQEANNITPLTGDIQPYVFVFTGKPGMPHLSKESDTGVSNNDGMTKNTTPIFTGTAIPNSSIKIYLDAKSNPEATVPVDASGTWTWTVTSALTSGVHTIYASNASISDAISESLSFTIDTKAPVITITQTKNTNSLTLNGSAVDDIIGIDTASWQYRIGEGVWRSGNSVEIISAGKMTVYFSVADIAGNIQNSSITVQLDSNPPDVNITIIPTGVKSGEWTNQSPINVVATITDDSGTVTKQYSLDGINWLTYNDGNISATENGITKSWFKGIDAAGNTTTKSTEIWIDKTAPVVTTSINTVDVINDKWTNITSVSVSATVIENGGSGLASFQYSFNGTDWTSYTIGSNITIDKEGANQIWFQASDNSGSVATESLNIKLDRVGPSINSLFTPSGVINGEWTRIHPVTVTGYANDMGAGVDESSWEYSDNYSSLTPVWKSGKSVSIDSNDITNIYFRVKDILGNMGMPVPSSVKIDTIGPVITAELENQFVNKTLKIKTLSAVDSSSGMPAQTVYQYRLNDTDAWSEFTIGTAIIIPNTISAGRQNLQIKTADTADNESIVKIPFTIDRNGPTINTISIKNSDASDAPEITESDFASSSTVYVGVKATDDSSLITSCQFLISGVILDTPNFNSGKQEFDTNFIITGLQNGINYLYLKAFDQTGNESLVYKRVIRVDSIYPGKPNLISITHPKALSHQDAISLKDAVFIISPAKTGPSGIKSYHYILNKGNEVFAEGDNLNGRLELLNLFDNLENEYYILKVKAVSGNGLSSLESAEYKFRIDSTPPKFLKITSGTHANPDVWYGSTLANISWNKPMDFTGVKTYYYKISNTVIDMEDAINWFSINEQTLTLDLANALGANSGTLYFAVCAEDFAGNKQFDQMHINFDAEAPYLEKTINDKFIEIAADSQKREAAITWGTPKDNKEVARVEVKVRKLDDNNSNNWIIKEASAVNETFSGLSTETNYLVYVKVVDIAGNEKYYAQGFNLEGTAVPEIATPFSQNIQGFILKGTTYSGATPPEASLEIPASLKLIKVVNDQEFPVSELNLDDKLIFDGTDFITGGSRIKYKVNLADYDLTGEGITFSKSNGLTFNTITYTVETSAGNVKSFTYNNVNVTTPPQLLFKNSAVSTSTDFRFDSVPYTDYAFSFTNSTTTIFKNSNWYLDNCKVDLLNYNGYINLSDGGTSSLIKVKNTSITPDHKVISGIIDETFYTEVGDNLLEIINAAIEKDKVIVLKARLILPNGFASVPVYIENFSINGNGDIIQHDDFRFNKFNFTYDGVIYQVDTIGFSGRHLLFSGNADIGEVNIYPFSVMLTKDGVNENAPISIGGFSKDFFGFNIHAASALMRKDGIFFQNATIELPTNLGGAQNIQGFLLSKDQNTILSAGTTLPYQLYSPAYGNTIIVTTRIDNTGVFGINVNVTLPGFTGGSTVNFKNLPMTTAGFGRSEPSSFTLPDFSGFDNVSVKEAKFDGSIVEFGQVEVVMTGYTPDLSVFTGYSFNYNNILTSGVGTSIIDINSNGWIINVSGLILKQDGIFADSALNINKANITGKVTFFNTKLLKDGQINISGYGTSTDLKAFGFALNPNNMVLNDNKLKFNCNLTASFFNDKSVDFTDIVIDSTGQLAGDVNTVIKDIDFNSTNRFKVGAKSFALTNNGLMFGGDITFPDMISKDTTLYFNTPELKLTSDGNIISSNIAGPVTLKYAGFDMISKAISFNEFAITFGEASLMIFDPPVSLSMQNLTFAPDGTMISGGQILDLQEIERYDWKIKLSEIIIGNSQINAIGSIKLPVNLGGQSLEFGGFTILPDEPYIISNAAKDNVIFTVSNTQFELSNLNFSKNGLMIGNGTITLGGELNTVMNLSDFSIDGTGSFNFNGMNIETFQMYGYNFDISGISITDQVMSFEGELSLDSNFLLKELIGKSFNLVDVKINLNGSLNKFEVDGDSFCTIMPEGIALNGGSLTLAENFPGCLSGADVSVNKFVLTPGGSINELDATLSFIGKPDQELIGGLKARDGYFNVNIKKDDPFEFTLGGSLVFPDDAPGVLSNFEIPITKIRIDSEAGFKEFSATKKLSETKELIGGLLFKNGEIGVDVSGDPIDIGRVFFNLSGNLVFSDTSPILAGFEIPIDKLTVGLNGHITNLKSTIPINGTVPFIDNVMLKDANLNIDASGDMAKPSDVQFGITGNLVMPENNLGDLSKSVLKIDDLKFDASGNLKKLNAHLDMKGDTSFIGGTKIRNPKISVSADSQNTFKFGIKGTLIMPDDAPGCLSSAEMEIISFIMDTKGNISNLSASVTLPNEGTLLPGINLRNSSIGINITDGNPVEFKIKGTLILTADILGDLKGKEVLIKDLTILSDGSIASFDCYADGINLSIYDKASVKNGTLSGKKGLQNDEIIFLVTGTLILPDSLPAEFRGLSIEIEKLSYSNTRGLLDFAAGINTNIEKTLFADVKAVFTSIILGKDSISLGGNIIFPDSFPEGLKGLNIRLNKYEMGWDGSIKVLDASIAYISFKVAEFKIDVTNFIIHSDGISFDSCVLNLPSNMSGKKLGFKNAGINKNGKFYGEFIDTEFEKEIVTGFTLKVFNPAFDMDNKEIKFSKAIITTPDFVGSAEYTLYGVKIKPDGLSVTGCGFKLPNFNVGEALQFRGIAIDFYKDGNSFNIEGKGGAFIAGASGVYAEVSFTNRSTMYPIGIRNAYFEYKLISPGIPIANTGLFITEFEGGLAFGPPYDVPDDLRNMFDNGIRIRVGASVADESGGSVVKASGSTWIDITNGNWALSGSGSVLNGMASGSVIAAITGKGFLAKLDVSMRFVRGTVEVMVFNYNGSTRVNGAGSVKVGLPQGSIFHWEFSITINYLFGSWTHTWTVDFPPSDWWLGPIGAEFGTFTNGHQGFKGYVHVPCFGEVGFFASNGGIDIGGVSEYTLYRPFNMSMAVADNSKSGDFTSGIYKSLFVANEVNNAQNTLKFTVPTKTSAIKSLSTNQTQENQEGVERLVFVIGYFEGNPDITAVSPSGKEYKSGDSDVMVEYIENAMLFVVLNPEAGEWTLKVDNIEADTYAVKVFGKSRIPDISVDTPKRIGENSGDIYKVSGSVKDIVSGAVVTVYISEDKKYLGKEAGKAILNEDGTFVFNMDTSALSDGEYFIYAGVSRPLDQPDVKKYAEGTIIIKHNAPLKAVKDFVAIDNGKDSVEVAFNDINGGRTKGFYLLIDNLTNNTSEKIKLGYITRTSLSGFNNGDNLRAAILPYDTNNIEGKNSGYINLTIGSKKDDTNSFDLLNTQIPVNLITGDIYHSVINIKTISPVVTGSAYDFAELKIIEAPIGLFIKALQKTTNIIGVDPVMEYQIAASDQMVPGVYTVKAEVSNLGNQDNKKDIVFTINLNYPGVIISRVSPDSWNNLNKVNLEVFGMNFFNGTRLFLDDRELTMLESNNTYLKAEIPAGIKSGTKTVKVIGPTGTYAEQNVNVISPDYMLSGIKKSAFVKAGGRTELLFTIIGQNGFSNNVGLELNDIPQNWIVSLDKNSIKEKEIATIALNVPENEQTGEKNISISTPEGKVLFFNITVTSTDPDPVISGISAISGFSGERIAIYGDGFGTQGILKIGTLTITPISYSSTKIEFIIPDDAYSGDLTVFRDGKISNIVLFNVKKIGFNIYPSKEQMSLQPGESTSVELNILGYSGAVKLSISTSNQLITAELSRISVVPNAMVYLNISADKSIPNGEYSIVISGISERMNITKTIKVVITDAFSFPSIILPSGIENTYYKSEIKTKNGEGVIEFGILTGTLPSGLSLSENGIISGIPLESGEYPFEIKAVDARNREITGRFKILISPGDWYQTEGNSGRTKFNAIESPADNSKLWTSSAYSGAKEIITGHDRIFILTENGVIALYKGTGLLSFKYIGSFKRMIYAGIVLYLLGNDNIVYALDSQTGFIKWTRQNVSHMTSDGNQLVLAENNQISIIDATNGTLISSIPAVLPSTGIYVWQNNTLLHAHGTNIEKLTNNGWVNIYNYAKADIKEFAADSRSIAILTADGHLIILDKDNEVVGKLKTSMTSGEIVLTNAGILVASDSKIECMDRSDLKVRFEKGIAKTGIAGALEKIFVANPAGLTCINGFNGKDIWSISGGHLDLALSGEYLYALGTDGKVTCYNGKDNINYPTTAIKLTPGEPDGENNWFKTLPIIELEASDLESYVSKTYYSYKYLPYVEYNGAFQLPEGTTSITAYSVDNHGYREPDVLKTIQIDSVKPETKADLSGTGFKNGYFRSAVMFKLTAEDVTSGVKYTEYRLDNKKWTRYNGEFIINDDGYYSIDYRSLDNAGNIEEEKEIGFVIDTKKPNVEASIHKDPGFAIIYLKAYDHSSGVDSIEYRLDDGVATVFNESIIVTAYGDHVIKYHAKDRTGNVSEEKTLEFEVKKIESGELIRDLHFATNKPGRSIIKNVNAGQTMYSPNKGKIEAFPEYIKNSYYIMTNIDDHSYDGDRFITFEAGADIDVYIMKHIDSKANLSGWTLVERNYRVNREYFKDGADIYKKSFIRGEQILIPGSDNEHGSGNLYFVKQNLQNYLIITNPEPGKYLLEHRTYKYSAVFLSGIAGMKDKTPIFEWFVQYNKKNWNKIGDSSSGTIMLPDNDRIDRIKFKVIVKFKDTGIELTKSIAFKIIDMPNSHDQKRHKFDMYELINDAENVDDNSVHYKY